MMVNLSSISSPITSLPLFCWTNSLVTYSRSETTFRDMKNAKIAAMVVNEMNVPKENWTRLRRLARNHSQGRTETNAVHFDFPDS